MKRFVLYLCTLLVSLSAIAQQSGPGIQWQKAFGGSGDDVLNLDYTFAGKAKVQVVARDKTHLFIGGTTKSTDGDINTPLNGNEDMWVAKVDLSGNIVWKTGIPGKDFDDLRSLTETSDGSVLVFGASYIWPTGGTYDAMLTKLAPNGTVVWKKYYGGTNDDYGNKIIETRDGGYAFIGTSMSADGSLAGYSPSNEVWAGKLNSNGDLLWNRKFAGVPASDQYDYGVAIAEDPQGNLYIGANLRNAANASPNLWHRDIMLARLNRTGDTTAWSTILQGTGNEILYDLKVVGTNKLIIAGSTDLAEGDFPGPNLGFGRTDAFLMTLDLLGNKTFFKRFGGSGSDEIRDLVVLPDQSYLTVGNTNSANGYLAGDSLRFNDAWVANIATDGQVLWSRKYGGSSTDRGMSIGALSETSFVFFGQTASNDLNVSGNHGANDFWLVKLGSTSTLKGTVYYDDNGNNVKDAAEPWAYNAMVDIIKTSYNRSIATMHNGGFSMQVDTGAYSISATAPYYTAAAQTKSFTTYGLSDSLSFGLKPVAGNQDLVVNLIPMGPARPGFGLSYKILYRNAGTITINNAVVTFEKDSRLTVNSATPTATGGTGAGLNWNLGSLAPRDSGSIVVNMKVATPPTTNNGDFLRSTATITPATGDVTPLSNTSLLNQVVVGSYDPNDKQEASGGIITQARAASGEYLNYLIRFQNTGTDTAFNVSVRDTLDAKLDWNTLEMVASSHPYVFTITDDNKLLWKFNNILLVDSNRNEPASHGFIAYKIKAKNTAAVGDQIKNEASIYFDYNLPVVTNEYITTVVTSTPDLVITSSTSAATAFQGSVVRASFTVTNNGTTDAATSQVFFYQSPDATLTPGQNNDAFLFAYPVATLAPGATTGPVTRDLPLPCNQPAGNYYIFLVADGGNAVIESDENNNTTSNALTVQALEVTTTAASVCVGNSVTLTASGAANFSWSPATGLSATTGATVTATPASTTTYTVTGTTIFCSATKTVTVEVTPIVTPSVSIGYTGCPGNNLAFTAAPANGGSNPVIDWYVNNNKVYTGATYTLNNAQNGMQVYATLSSNAACASPLTATSSTVTLSCIVPTIDLVASGSVTPTTVVIGNTVNASFSISNTGNTEAPASKVAFYVSADDNLTPGQNGDMYLGSYNLAAIPAGGSVGPITQAVPVLCTFFVPGNYYIFLEADGDRAVSETSESNNRLSTLVTVLPLEISVSPASATICSGASTTLTASGASSYTWTPSTGLNATTGATVTANPTTNTTYTVTGTTNGCTATKTATVTVNATVAPAISISYTGCPTNTLAFTASITNGGSTPVVEWFVNNTLSGTGGSYTLNSAQNGAQVYAKLTSNATCASPQSVNSSTVLVNCVTTSVPEVDGVEEITLAPNPTRGVVTVRFKLVKSKTVSLKVTDAHGKQVAAVAPERFSGVKTKTVDLRKAAAGIYYLQIQLDGQLITEKILRIN
jgi:uncharacterized repeat protein (TIGR01451 family)